MFHPFPYQSDCLLRLKEVRASGATKALVIMASGLGKTVTAALDVKQWRETQGKSRLLYICHQTDILVQAKTTFEAILGNHLSYDFLHGKRKALHGVDCLFASFQTMSDYSEFFKPEEFDYILVDESHHTHAETYLPVVNYYKPKFILAVTATPDREDGLDIRDVYGREVFNLPLEEALAKGYLTPVDYKLMTDEIELKSVLAAGTEKFSVKELNRRVFVKKRDDEVARIIQDEAAKIADPRIIVFCSSVAHCDYLCPYLTNGLAIHSGIPAKEKDLRLELFRQGIINIAFTVDCFNEGIDIPEANLIVFLRSTSSLRIFTQQLGRGLRLSKTKEKVMVLDFAGNCERVKFVTDFVNKVKKFQPSLGGDASPDGPFHVSGEGFDFTFNSKAVDLLSIMERMRKDFYPTWQEASEAAKNLKIKSFVDYQANYDRGDHLPSHPDQFYSDFPGWGQFLGTGNVRTKSFYPTWEEASAATQGLGISSSTEYPMRYKADPLLPSRPHVCYEDFPGWQKFLDSRNDPKDFYPTIQEAAEVARKLGINGSEEYFRLYKSDPRLPCNPQAQYSDFSGWKKFLDTDRYSTWQESAKAAIALGISSVEDYRARYKEDKRLPSSPNKQYADFPEWKKFLGKK